MKKVTWFLLTVGLPMCVFAQPVDLATYGNGAPIAEVNTIAGIRSKLAESCKQNAECMTYFSVEGGEVKQVKPRPPVPMLSTPEMKAKLVQNAPAPVKP